MTGKTMKINGNKLILFLSFILILSGCKLNNPFTPPLAKGPTLDQPVDGEKIRPGNKIQFRWKYVKRQESYCLQVSKTSNFNSPFIDTTSIESGNYCNCSFLFLEKVKYYWRVKVKTKTYHRWSDWSDIDSFIISTYGNRPPIKPNNPFPPDSATGFSTDSLALNWDSGDPDGDTVFYTVYFDTNSSFTSPDTIIKDSSCFTTATISYQLPFNLERATTYYWKVSAKDNFDTVSVGDLWFFTTEDTSGGNPPDIPGNPNISTAPYYVDEPLTATATTIDPENDPILYMFDYGDGSATHWTQPVASGQAVVDTHIYNVPFNCYGYFYIKVKAKDMGGRQSDWSDSIQVQVKIREGAMFVCFPNNAGPIVHISSKGTFLDSVGHQQCSALDPATITIDQRFGNSPGGDVWAASTNNQQVFRFNNHLNNVLLNRVYSVPKESNPSTPCVDKDGNCWFAFAWWGKIVKLSPVGDTLKTILVPLGTHVYDVIPSIAYDEARGRIWAVEFAMEISGGAQPGRLFLYDTSGTLIKASATYDFCGSYLDIDSSTGDCWVANAGFNNVIRVSADGNTIDKFAGFNQPASLSVDNVRRKIWISDTYNHRIVIINFGGGTQVIDQYALGSPSGIKAYSPDGSCWVTDPDSFKVMKFNSSGDTLFTRRVSIWGQPAGVAVDYFERE
ncbi:MAG: hypothetical protein WC614_03035 [bacterium]